MGGFSHHWQILGNHIPMLSNIQGFKNWENQIHLLNFSQHLTKTTVKVKGDFKGRQQRRNLVAISSA